MRHSPFRIPIIVAIFIAGLLGASQSSAIAAAPVTPAPAPAAAADGGGVSVDNTGSSSDGLGIAATCTFFTEGDYVHVSSTAFEASGHGWWVNGDCPATWAVVTVQLQEFYSDGSWRNKGTVGQATVRSGGGAGNRATGRAGCNDASVTGWRSVVDVDLVGLADDPNKLITPARNIGCRRL